jgi:O-antigen/teichoic acid export membrane protein
MLKNISFYSIGNIIPQAAGFILLPIYTRYLTPSDYGIISSMQVLSAILTVFFTIAIDRSIYRLYFDYKTDKDKRDYLGTITISIFFISMIILLLLFVFKGVVGGIYKTIEFYPYYVYAILTAFFAVFSIIPKIYFQLNKNAGKFVIISILQFLLSTGFILWFVIGEKSGADGMLKGMMFANIVLLPVFIYVSIKIINFTFNAQILKESIAFSLPMIPALLSAWVLNLSDRVFIERYLDIHDVGIYSLGYKIAGLVHVFAYAFFYAYGPVFYKLANSENQEIAKIKIYNYNNIYIKTILIMLFLIALFSKEAIQLLLDPKYYEAYKIVPIIALAYFISEVSGLFNLMIYQEKKVIALASIGIAGAILNILLNFLFIKPFGLMGAAYATIISFIVIIFLSWMLAKKCYYIPIEWRKLFQYIVGGASIVFILFFLDLGITISLLIKLIITTVIIAQVVMKNRSYFIELLKSQ